MVTHAQLTEAMEYINLCIKAGYVDKENFDDMSDEEIVRWAHVQPYTDLEEDQ